MNLRKSIKLNTFGKYFDRSMEPVIEPLDYIEITPINSLDKHINDSIYVFLTPKGYTARRVLITKKNIKLIAIQNESIKIPFFELEVFKERIKVLDLELIGIIKDIKKQGQAELNFYS